MARYIVFTAALLATTALAGQLQTSNIYMFNMKQVSDSVFQFSNPQYLTAFNAAGYNNQPEFFNNDELYITSQLPAMQQPELFLLNLQTRTKIRVTETVDEETGEVTVSYEPVADLTETETVERKEAA